MWKSCYQVCLSDLYLYFQIFLECQWPSTCVSNKLGQSFSSTWLGKVNLCNSQFFSNMVVELETEPDVDFSTSVFVDDYQLVDSALLGSKLGDTCTGVQGRLLGKL